MSQGLTIGPHREKEDAAARAAADLFAHPPKSSIDLRERLAGVHRPTLRETVINKLVGPGLSDRDGPLILAILDVVGIGDERPRLVSIALNSSGEPRVRMWAAMALASDDPRMMDLLVTELGPEGMAHLAENALIDLITIQQPSRIGTTVVRALEEWHRDLSSEKLLDRIESCRQGLGVSCVEAYGPALLSRRLESLRSKILDFFVAEASDEGAEFILALREQDDMGDRHKLQSALLRLRSAVIDPKHMIRPVQGTGYISNCDGNGGYIVLGVFDNADGTQSVSELYLHVLGDILDGMIHPRLRSDQAKEVIEQLRLDAGCHFVAVPLEESAALAYNALDKLGSLMELERVEIRQALRIYHVAAGRPRRSESPPGNDVAISEEALRDLMNRPEYEDTWLLDAADMEVSPDESESDEGGLRSIVNHLSTSAKRDQITAMADHMARWHAWNNDRDAAALMSALATASPASDEFNMLLRLMVERSRG